MGAGIEQGRRRAHEVEGRQHVIELDGAPLAVDLVQRQAHRNAHEERLRQLEAAAGAAELRVLIDQKIAVVERLQAEVAELQVALGFQRRAELLQVVVRERFVQEADLDAVLDQAREALRVARRHIRVGRFLAQRLEADRVEQEPRGDEAVGGILFDQRARGENEAFAHLVHRHAFVQILERRFQDALGLDVGQAFARGLDELGQAGEVERPGDAVIDHVDRCAVDFAAALFLLLVGALLRALFAIKHVGARDFVLAAAHQRELDLVLNFLDVDRAALGLALHQRVDHHIGEVRSQLAHAGRRRALSAVDGEKRLGHRNGDLRRLERHHRAVAADDLVLGERRIGAGRERRTCLAGHQLVLCCGGCGGGRASDLHSAFSSRNLIFLGLNHAARQHRAIPTPARASGGRPGERWHAFSGRFTGASGFPLGIKTYYILCSSAESTLIIVAWQNGRKRFLMFLGGLAKLPRNQSSTAPLWRLGAENPPFFHAIVHRGGGQLDASKVTRV